MRANIDAKIRALDIIKRDLEVAELETDDINAEQVCCCQHLLKAVDASEGIYPP